MLLIVTGCQVSTFMLKSPCIEEQYRCSQGLEKLSCGEEHSGPSLGSLKSDVS